MARKKIRFAGHYTRASRSRHPTAGHITATSTSFAVTAVSGARMVVYTPDDKPSAKALARLAEGAELDARFPCWVACHPERALLVQAAV